LINRTELPVLTKATLMENFDQPDTRSNLRLTDVVDYLSRLAGTSCSSSAYYVSATGGTTGRRGVFLRTFAEWMQVVGSYDRAFNWAGSTAGLTHWGKTGGW
jgi:phenylacetate-CoA ligase